MEKVTWGEGNEEIWLVEGAEGYILEKPWWQSLGLLKRF